ncbi:unnamed protein product [Triticum turgidum subsp. durum]|uniref:Nucleoside phosphorylase domain-containing protein n=1 Tax=Triticum turgidum subsp. durum TaxID=4567 RepID=A0A9R0Z2G9_TRITD|nr:unnamed protein product [Triticum turgidum subsp. durum]
MAPPSSEEPAAASGAGAISKVLVVIAMQTEALPLVTRFQLVEAAADDSMLEPVGPQFSLDALKLTPFFVGTHLTDFLKVPLGLGTMATTKASTSISSGLEKTLCLARGAGIGDVFLASDVAFHDRRIPIPVFDSYGIGARKTFETPNIVKELNLKVGKLSTGDSLDMSPHDETAILSNEATVKDMEGAAVAYVADLFSTPAIFVKAVTDIVDGEKPTAEEFLQNLISVTMALDQVMQQCAGEDEETTPLSGDQSFFTAIMCKTHVQKPYLLVGDACVFELVSGYAGDGGKREVVLEVQVLRRGGLPEPEDLATKGDTADEPIVIME